MKDLLGLGLALVASAAAAPAWACGACVSPVEATLPQTVVQDAERVLFVRDESTKTSHVWVEVRYSGLAKDFGWVLPLPKLPKVGVGSRLMFDRLDQAMQPRYYPLSKGDENCRDPYDGCEPGSFSADVTVDAVSSQDSSSWSDGAGGGGQPGVQILGQGSTGPYDYTLLTGSDSSALYAWLTARGYALPEKAKPILQSHLAKGDVFVAVKLSNGQGVKDIRPIALEMPDAEPCVPLRLTSIAAKEDLSVVVTVAGSSRAIVKNHLDVVINPLRLAFLNNGSITCSPPNCNVPGNYQQVLSAAIDSVGGHAFVTESSLPGSASGAANNALANASNSLASVKSMAALATALAWSDLPLNEEVAEAVALPLALTATFPGVSALQTLANLKACGQFWNMGQGQPCNLLQPKSLYAELELVAVDGAGAKAALDKALVEPLAKIAALVGGAPRVTRLVMRISPEEMDRDPVFAFNPALPPVPRDRLYQVNSVCTNGWAFGPRATRIGWDGLGSWVFTQSNALDPRFVDAPLVLQAALQDEQGAPLVIDPSQYELVDTAILGALPGKPSLPKDMVLKTGAQWLPPPSDPLVTKVTPWHKPPDCAAKPGWVDGQLPPKPGEVVDAGADGADGLVADAGGLSDTPGAGDGGGGAVPGIDAAGGWADAADAGASDLAPAPAAAAAKDDGGCGAAARPAGGLWALLLVAGLWLWRRGGRVGGAGREKSHMSNV